MITVNDALTFVFAVLYIDMTVVLLCHIWMVQGYKALPYNLFISCGRIEDDTYRKQPVNVRLRPYMALSNTFRLSLHKEIKIYRPRKAHIESGLTRT